MLAGCVPWPAELAERYRRDGYWRGEPLGSLLRGPAATAPDRVAVVAGGVRHTYGELDARADRLAAGLHDLGLRRHDRVVVQLPNTVDLVLTCVALFRLGALPVLALPAHRKAELTYLAGYSAAVALVVAADPTGGHLALARDVTGEVPSLRHVLVSGPPELTRTLTPPATAAPGAAPGTTSRARTASPADAVFLPLAAVDAPARDLPAPDPGDVAFFLLSGGTTGLPKLIPRTHDDYAYQLRATADAMGFDERGAYLAVLPAAHNAALGCPGVLGALWAGGRAVLASSPSPDEAFPLVRAEGVTLTTLMPPILALWTELAPLLGVDLAGVTIEVGGATLSPEVARRVRPALGATLTHWFGMAEGVLCFTRTDDPDEVAATTQGYPMCPADEYRIVDDDGRDVPSGEAGQLIARGPCTLRGYYAVPEHNATVFTGDGFLRTGDLARFTAEGRLVVTGRIKDVVNRGGEKISADEVEAHLVAHPGVRRAAVVALPDRSLGEKSCAVVVATGEPPTLADLKRFLTERGLAEFKLPDRLELVDALPHTGVGKVDKRALVAALTGAPVAG